MPTSPRTRRAALLLLLASTLCTLFFAEIALRLFDEGDNMRITSSLDIFAPHPQAGFGLIPNLTRLTYWNGKKVHIQTNSAGRRVPYGDYTEINGRAKLIFCGDSYVFGNEENAADTFVFRSAQRLERDGINLGVGGYSTFQSIYRLQEFTAAHSVGPGDRALLCFFVGNDFHDNISAKERIKVDHLGRLEGADRQSNPLIRNLVYRSRLLAFVVLRLRSLQLNLEYRRAGLYYEHIYASQFYTPEILAKTRQALTLFRDHCAKVGLPLSVVILPDKDQVYKDFKDSASRRRPNQVLIGLLDELDMDYIDLLPPMLQAKGDLLYNMTPAGHLSVRGHQLVAEHLVERFGPSKP